MKLKSVENKKIDVLQAIDGKDVELHINGWLNSVTFIPNIILNQINNKLGIISDIWSFSIDMDVIREVKKIGMDYEIILNTGLEFIFFVM